MVWYCGEFGQVGEFEADLRGRRYLFVFKVLRAWDGWRNWNENEVLVWLVRSGSVYRIWFGLGWKTWNG